MTTETQIEEPAKQPQNCTWNYVKAIPGMYKRGDGVVIVNAIEPLAIGDKSIEVARDEFCAEWTYVPLPPGSKVTVTFIA